MGRTPKSPFRFRTLLERDQKERRGTRELSCPLLTMWGYLCLLHRVEDRYPLLWVLTEKVRRDFVEKG